MKRRGACVNALEWPAAAGHLEKIRFAVTLNLGIGLAIIALMKLGR